MVVLFEIESKVSASIKRVVLAKRRIASYRAWVEEDRLKLLAKKWIWVILVLWRREEDMEDMDKIGGGGALD
ncbi:unnamed protein product [Dovyalis caffra]|uniref:Uncharacterized protein n=1 Tax=Dovyalis caffra TaxID=77055 RepID=A0AAV1SQC7_9ROSI|nr:unnamed protein product [Dovyalis caffra]